MEKRILIGSIAIHQEIAKLTLLNEQSGLYINNDSKEEFVLTYYESEMLEKDIPVLEKQPALKVHELIELLFVVDDIEQIAGLSSLIFDREFDHSKSERLFLIEKLEHLFDKDDSLQNRQKIRLIIYETGIYNDRNQDDIIGKSINQISDDASFYKSISKRASHLLTAID